MDLYTANPTQIVMYTTEYCSECNRAKAFFEANDVPYLRVGESPYVRLRTYDRPFLLLCSSAAKTTGGVECRTLNGMAT